MAPKLNDIWVALEIEANASREFNLASDTRDVSRKPICISLGGKVAPPSASSALSFVASTSSTGPIVIGSHCFYAGGTTTVP